MLANFVPEASVKQKALALDFSVWCKLRYNRKHQPYVV